MFLMRFLFGKLKILALIFILSGVFKSRAQKIITTESEELFHNGPRNAICTQIYRSDIKNVIIAWENYLKQFKYETVSLNKNEVYGHNLFFINIINRTVDIYSSFEAVKETQTIKMRCTIDLGASNYLKSSSNPKEIKEEEKMVKDFAIKMTKAPFEELLTASNLKRDKLIKENVSLEKEIKEAKENIIDFNKKLIKLQKDSAQESVLIQNINQSLEAQKKTMDTIKVKESVFAKSSKKSFDKLLSQKNSSESDVKEINDKIKVVREKTQRAETDVKVNSEFIVKNNSEIENQKTVAEDLKKKLEQIN